MDVAAEHGRVAAARVLTPGGEALMVASIHARTEPSVVPHLEAIFDTLGSHFEGDWVERMPENAPPKWIFRNVTAIRENTERILQLLESEDQSEAS